MRDLARIFKALADETRLQMLALLLERGELCVCDLETALQVTQSKASRHLRYLANAGLVRDRRDGTWVLYRVAEDPRDDAGLVIEFLREVLRTRDLRAVRARLEDWLAKKGGRAACAPGRRPPSRTKRRNS